MKKKLIVSLTILTLVLAACGGQSTQTPPEPAAPTQVESTPPSLTVPPPTETTAPTETAIPTTEMPAVAGVSFANDILPILEASCSECHGGRQTKAGLDMKTYEGLMAGSFDGAVIVPGSSADSLLIQMVESGKMPKRGDKLTAEQIQVISDWIAAGALNN